MKRRETILLENALIDETRDSGIYGCEEITIGFANNGHGDEVVDFMTMDSKGIIKCYELKVTKQDLKSKAKKSWYGNYNYLVTTAELYEKIDNWDDYIPNDIGIIVGRLNYIGKMYLSVERKCKKKKIDAETQIMLKESMVRSMYHKMLKYKDACDIDKMKAIKSELNQAKRDAEKYRNRANEAEGIIRNYEGYYFSNHGIDIDLKSMLAKEEELYWSRFRTKKDNDES